MASAAATRCTPLSIDATIMTSDAPAMRPEFRRKILLSILLPVLVVGGALSTASVVYLTPPLTAFIQEHIDAQLKLASGLGMSICENHFNYLLELRLENNPEFNSALKISLKWKLRKATYSV